MRQLLSKRRTGYGRSVTREEPGLQYILVGATFKRVEITRRYSPLFPKQTLAFPQSSSAHAPSRQRSTDGVYSMPLASLVEIARGLSRTVVIDELQLPKLCRCRFGRCCKEIEECGVTGSNLTTEEGEEGHMGLLGQGPWPAPTKGDTGGAGICRYEAWTAEVARPSNC